MINTQNKKWNIKSFLLNDELVNKISVGLGISLPLSTILVNRGYDSS